MAVKRTSPEEYRISTGHLRLWRDDIATIVSLVQQLTDAEITLEADHHTLDDLGTDLPELGPRVEYFKVIATRMDDDKKKSEVLRLQLGGCSSTAYAVTNPWLRLDEDRLRASDPSLETRAVIYEIVSFIQQHRRHGMAATSILYTGTRADAPTWWQEYRSHIAIAVVIGVVFYLLGLLTAHL
jgi:hypothetical protein